MMPFQRTFCGALLGILLCFGATACDKPNPAPTEEQQKKNTEGDSWRSLLQTLDQAPDDEARLEALQQFVEANPEHPDLADAKQRIEQIEKSEAVQGKKVFEATKARAIEEGDPVAMAGLYAAEIARIAGPRILGEQLSQKIEIPTSEGLQAIEKSIVLNPTTVRGYIRIVLAEHAPSLIEERCTEECVNAAANALAEKGAGGSLFVERGKMNPDAVGPLLEKAWLKPDAELLGMPARQVYLVFEPTIQAYAKSGVAVKEAGGAEAATELAALEDRRAVADFYTKFAEENAMAKKTGLSARDARAFAGWWLRRYADGTAGLFEAHLTKVLEAYGEPAPVESPGPED